jgi:transposase
VLRSKLTRDHLSAAAALTPDGKLYLQIQREAFDGTSIIRFLKRLLRQIPGKLLVIWDGLPAHHSKLVRSFLADGAAERVHLERLPAYAPELNPVELIWGHLKHVELRNACFP